MRKLCFLLSFFFSFISFSVHSFACEVERSEMYTKLVEANEYIAQLFLYCDKGDLSLANSMLKRHCEMEISEQRDVTDAFKKRVLSVSSVSLENESSCDELTLANKDLDKDLEKLRTYFILD